MDRFPRKIKNRISEVFDGLPADVALIGSGSDTDLDIFVAINSFADNYHSVKSVIDRLPLLLSKLDCDIFVKHEHLCFVPKRGRRLVHLLFYPSYKHLQIWELPSFLACVYKRGEFCIGDSTRLAGYYKDFRSRKFSHNYDILTYHTYVLMDLAVTSLLYLTVNSEIFPSSRYFDDLIYVFRYSLREFLLSQVEEASEIVFWEWDELLEYIDNKQEMKGLGSLLRLKEEKPQSLSKDELIHLFLEYLRFCDMGLSGVGQLNILNILQRPLI